MRKMILVSVLAVVAVTARGETSLTQADLGAVFATMKCSLIFKNDQASGKSELDPCIEDGQKSMKANYLSVLKKVKKASAKAALKEYYIAATTALQGVSPMPDERVYAYEKRQNDNKTKMDEMWLRFELAD